MTELTSKQMFEIVFEQVVDQTKIDRERLKQGLDAGARTHFITLASIRLITEGGGSIPRQVLQKLEGLNLEGENMISQYGEDFYLSTLDAYMSLLRSNR